MSNEQIYQAVIRDVYDALTARGYDPCYQLSWYLLTGDPTYITSTNGARKKIMGIDRDELLREIVSCYLAELSSHAEMAEKKESLLP